VLPLPSPIGEFSCPDSLRSAISFIGWRAQANAFFVISDPQKTVLSILLLQIREPSPTSGRHVSLFFFRWFYLLLVPPCSFSHSLPARGRTISVFCRGRQVSELLFSFLLAQNPCSLFSTSQLRPLFSHYETIFLASKGDPCFFLPMVYALRIFFGKPSLSTIHLSHKFTDL